VRTLVIYAEVAEAVRNTIAAYTQALDDGRVDDVVATFCSDGVVDIEGMGTYEGHDALREAYEGWKPRGPQRHVVANTLVTDWSDEQATAVSDVIFMFKSDTGWQIFTVGRYEDTFHRDGDTWKFHRRAGSFVG
jgi:ketosteroid isomerase-like protein